MGNWERERKGGKERGREKEREGRQENVQIENSHRKRRVSWLSPTQSGWSAESEPLLLSWWTDDSREQHNH